MIGEADLLKITSLLLWFFDNIWCVYMSKILRKDTMFHGLAVKLAIGYHCDVIFSNAGRKTQHKLML